MLSDANDGAQWSLDSPNGGGKQLRAMPCDMLRAKECCESSLVESEGGGESEKLCPRDWRAK